MDVIPVFSEKVLDHKQREALGKLIEEMLAEPVDPSVKGGELPGLPPERRQ